MRVGALALQGGFAAHLTALRSLGHSAIAVRTPEDLAACEGLVLPGGESTVHWKLVERFGLRPALDAFRASGQPIFATCAGLIIAAAQVESPEQPSLQWLDVTVARNAWGRQIASFSATSDHLRVPMIFIRAPRIVRVGERVEVVDRYRGEPVLVREGNVTAATFHPELTDDPRVFEEVFGYGR